MSPSRVWKWNDSSILCSSLLWNLQTCDLFQTSALSSTILPCSQTVTCSASWEVFNSGFLALAKWVWDFYCYFIKCLTNLWATVVLVVPILMMCQCLKNNYFLPSYTFSINTSLGTREIEVGMCFIKKITSLLNKSALN